jgi:FXSXX-COOH protein
VSSLAPAVQLGEAQPVPIADLRDVPLDRLPADADCGHIVRRIMRGQENPSRVDVAMFNSAI